MAQEMETDRGGQTGEFRIRIVFRVLDVLDAPDVGQPVGAVEERLPFRGDGDVEEIVPLDQQIAVFQGIPHGWGEEHFFIGLTVHDHQSLAPLGEGDQGFRGAGGLG